LALLVAGTALLLLHRVDRGPAERIASPAVSQPTADDTAATAALLVVLGDAMIDSGYTVTQVQTTLRQVLDVSGIPDGEVIVLPTAVFVSVPGQARVETALAAVGLSGMRLDQVEGVSRVVTAAETGHIAPTNARVALANIRSQAPPFGSVARTLGYAVFSAGLALILSGGAADVIVAAALGAVVGAIQLAVAQSGAATRAVLPVLCAFLVSTSVFVLGRFSADISVLAPLVAPLVTFLPGALLTTAVVELSTGQMISGSGRLAAGLLQLVLLALGIVAGAQLVGVSSIGAIGDRPLGDFGPWIGVALFGIGVLVYHCARRSSFGWILLVLYVAYGAQIIGGLFLGPLLSAFIGALVMSPVASYIALRPTGPPTQVSFLPAFWLLVPGALGLVGLTQLLGNDRADALSSLLSMGTTMIGISFGVLVGLAIGATIARHVAKEALAGQPLSQEAP
jgi:uncharacterized membrane protein YjjP (DUF1212 family)